MRKGEEDYGAECVELAVVTQGRTIDETLANLREAVALHLPSWARSRLKRLSGDEVPAILLRLGLETQSQRGRPVKLRRVPGSWTRAHCFLCRMRREGRFQRRLLPPRVPT